MRTTAGKGYTKGQHSFAQVASANIQRSVLNRSCGHTTTFDSGLLIPIFVDEALPGDTMNMRMKSFTRLSTPKFPVMDNLYMDVFFFAVPKRLLWDNWQKMNGEQIDPGDSTDYLVPQVECPPGGWNENSMGDYFGIPTKVDMEDVNALPFRAYNLIYNEWFRDQNLIDSKDVPRNDGPDDPATYEILRRGKRHDYFTSALPFAQKGPGVQLPLGDTAPVTIDTFYGDGKPIFSYSGTQGTLLATTNSDQIRAANSPSSDDALKWNSPKLAGTADLTTATAVTINQLRESFQIQKQFERDARGGTRYIEILQSSFGVTSPDARLQRPEYLSGGSVPINIHPVASTSETTSPVGELGAFGTAHTDGMGFTKSFVEHCIIIGLVSVRAELRYQQGLERMWSRRTRFDHYWPALAHLGEQAILNKEIFVDGTAADQDVFGYQERYAEYRYKPSRVSGEFRSNADTSLDVWHLAQDFGSRPLLNETFIEERPPVSRVVVVQDAPQFLMDAFFTYKNARPMPTYSVPGLVDHF